MKAKVMPLLSKAFGPGNFDVEINAAIDFSQVNTVTNNPTSAVANSVSRSQTLTTNGTGGASGTAGVNGAQPTYPSTSSQSGGQYTSTTDENTTYVVGSIQQQITQNGGKLQKLTVAIMLNSHNSAVTSANDDSLKQMIASALGTTVDDITIGQMDFTSSAASSATTNTASVFSLSNNLLYVIAAAMLILILFITMLLVILKSKNKKRIETQNAQAAANANVNNQSERQLPPIKRNMTPLRDIEETIQETENNSYKRQIESFADKKPELVAQILKNWLKD
jgi:flagellar M-ring protein FliF